MAALETELAKPENSHQDTILQRDLEYLLDVAFALRSIPEDEMVQWLKGESSLVKPDNPHPSKVKYLGTPVSGITKEYEVDVLSGEKYRLVVHPKKVQGIQSNEVKVKFSKLYTVGENSDSGTFEKLEGKKIFYLLPLVARLPLKDVSYEKVRDFFEKNNGFVYDILRPEMTSFRDSYVQERPKDLGMPLILKNDHGEIVKRDLQSTTEPVWMDVYVNVYNISRMGKKEVRVNLEVAIPEKKVA